jgi:hypothetical protein
MATIFLVVLEADVSKNSRDGNTQKKIGPAVKRPSSVAPARQQRKNPISPEEPPRSQPEAPRASSNGPDVNINLQIHISADASPDQIDHIFMSMAKHLYKHGA